MPDFQVEDRLISYVAYHREGATGGAEGDDSYASLFLAGKFSGFDAAVALPGDGDQGGARQSVADGIGDDGIRDDLGSVIQRQLRGEDGGLADGSFLEDFAQVLRLYRGHLAHAHIIEDQNVGLSKFIAIAQIRAAGSRQRHVFQPRRHRHVGDGFPTRAGAQASGLGEEGLADAGLVGLHPVSKIG